MVRTITVTKKHKKNINGEYEKIHGMVRVNDW